MIAPGYRSQAGEIAWGCNATSQDTEFPWGSILLSHPSKALADVIYAVVRQRPFPG